MGTLQQIAMATSTMEAIGKNHPVRMPGNDLSPQRQILLR